MDGIAKSVGIDTGGPYTAQAIGPYGWWSVMDRCGINVLRNLSGPGWTTTDETTAKRTAEEWNAT